MNEFKKIVPKKIEKKRAISDKRSNSIKEENKKSMNTERFFTTYELFEKLNSNMKKKKKLKANSSSKKKKKSKIKKFLSLEHIKKKNCNEKCLIYNTHYSTLETDNNKKISKNSLIKEEFSQILEKSKELLSIQSNILIQCGKLNKCLSKSEIEIETKLKNESNNNGTNILPGMAKALYLLELKKEKKETIEKNIYIENDNSIKFEKNEEKIDNSFYIKKFNELNGFIGELGYSYIYNEFFFENYKKENLIIYFDNIQKLIKKLHQIVNEQNEILIRQEKQIKEYEIIINDYQNKINQYQYEYLNNNNNSKNKFDINLNESCKNKSLIENENRENNNNSNLTSHIYIKENLYFNENENKNNNFNKTNSENNCNINNINYNSKQCFNFEESQNLFKDNLKIKNILQKQSPKNTHYYNSYIKNQNKNKNYNNNYSENYNSNNNNEIINDSSINKDIDNNSISYNDKEGNKIMNQSISSEIKNNDLNYYHEQNILSSMINSGSFFESYKRNKELKHNLNFNYNERRVNNE